MGLRGLTTAGCKRAIPNRIANPLIRGTIWAAYGGISDVMGSFQALGGFVSVTIMANWVFARATFTLYQRLADKISRRWCRGIKPRVRDCENPQRFEPMNLSAACVTDGYA